MQFQELSAEIRQQILSFCMCMHTFARCSALCKTLHVAIQMPETWRGLHIDLTTSNAPREFLRDAVAMWKHVDSVTVSYPQFALAFVLGLRPLYYISPWGIFQDVVSRQMWYRRPVWETGSFAWCMLTRWPVHNVVHIDITDLENDYRFGENERAAVYIGWTLATSPATVSSILLGDEHGTDRIQPDLCFFKMCASCVKYYHYRGDQIEGSRYRSYGNTLRCARVRACSITISAQFGAGVCEFRMGSYILEAPDTDIRLSDFYVEGETLLPRSRFFCFVEGLTCPTFDCALQDVLVLPRGT